MHKTLACLVVTLACSSVVAQRDYPQREYRELPPREYRELPSREYRNDRLPPREYRSDRSRGKDYRDPTAVYAQSLQRCMDDRTRGEQLPSREMKRIKERCKDRAKEQMRRRDQM